MAEALGSRKLDQEPPGTEGCRGKPDGKAAVSSFGTRVEADRTLCQAPAPAKEKLVLWNPSRRVQSGAVGNEKGNSGYVLRSFAALHSYCAERLGAGTS